MASVGGEEDSEVTKLIRERLIGFILEHTTPSDDGTKVASALDEILLSYVVTVLQEGLSAQLDVSEFVEMLSVYFPQFSNIPTKLVIQWVSNVSEDMSAATRRVSPPPQSTFERVVTDLITQASGGKEPPLKEAPLKEAPLEPKEEAVVVVGGLALLREMFPLIPEAELGMVLSLSNDSLEKAVQILLLDGDAGPRVHRKKRTSTSSEEDDHKFLKERVVARYGFVDAKEDAKEFRPILPKEEPKKLVRYREGQVVSTKGERFTEVGVNSDGEEVKLRSYVSKAQQLRMQQDNQY